MRKGEKKKTSIDALIFCISIIKSWHYFYVINVMYRFSVATSLLR